MNTEKKNSGGVAAMDAAEKQVELAAEWLAERDEGVWETLSDLEKQPYRQDAAAFLDAVHRDR